MPFFIPIIIAVLALVAGGTVIAINWDIILIKLQGKKLAVLGARRVGKSHLIKFLTTGTIPTEYKQTMRPEQTGQRRFELKGLDLKIKDTLDLAGGDADDLYAEWKALVEEAELVLYLFRVDLVLENDPIVEARIEKDMKHIGMWLKKRNPRPTFFLVGTHGDLSEPDFTTLPPDKVGEYRDSVCSLPLLQKAVLHGGGAHRATVLIGSMKSLPETEALVYSLFKEVERKGA